MQTKTLQTKRALRTALLVLLLGVVGMTEGYAYDFSAVCPSGQTLYYNSIDAIHAELTYPGDTDWSVWEAWEGFEKPTGNLILPETVQHYGSTYTVTSIGLWAFGECTELTSLFIPQTVNSIDQYAFLDCFGIEQIVIDENNPVYDSRDECNAIIETLSNTLLMGSNNAIIPNTISTIGDCAFGNMVGGFTGLASINIPNSVITIGDYAFANCTGLSGDLVIPNSVTTIGEAAFAGCTGLTGTLTLSNSLSEIESSVFYGCGFTGSLVIPNTVTYIASDAFSGCAGFTGALDIPNSVVEIWAGAFSGCTGLTSLSIPQSVNFIDVNRYETPFLGCTGFERITIDENNPVYDSRNNCNAIIETGTNTLIQGFNCSTIPNNVTAIGSFAFFGCTGLTGGLLIPNAVTEIGSYAFAGCTGITSLTIGNSVEGIWHNVFGECTSLSNITILATTPPYFNDDSEYDAFSGVSCTTLTVPCGCKEIYESSNWSLCFPIIEDDCSSHMINIDNISSNGGNVSVSTNSANLGEEVQLTITPDAGMSLSSLTVCNANDPSQTVPAYPIGKNSYIYGFLMPPFDVVIKAVFTNGASIDEGNSIAVAVYPNPTNGLLKIEAEGIKSVCINNMLGQVIYEGRANGDVFEYDFGKHEAGVYLVRIETARGVAVKKVTVTR